MAEEHSLYKKYRPDELDKVFGNEETIESLQKKVKQNKIPQVILFHGPSGCGKTTLGRILANELKAGKNVVEMDSAQFTGIDTIREIRKNSRYKPIGAKYKVYLMDEVHMLSTQAQNAFLKELEDTPKHVYYFLCTTNPEKLISTVRSRCVEYQLDTLAEDEMKSMLKYILKKEKETLDKKVFKVIFQNSGGHPRHAINILEKVLSVPEKKRLKIAENYESETNESIDLARALMQRKSWSEVQEILKGLKAANPENIRRAVCGYCSTVLLAKPYKNNHQRAAEVLQEFIEPTYDSGFAQIVFACTSVYFAESDD